MLLALISPQLKKALEYSSGEITFDQLLRRLLSGHAHLWICATNSGTLLLTGVTRVVPYPNVKRLAIDLIVGKNLEAAYPFLGMLEKWAWSHGCREIESYCRPGMAKTLQAKGWRKAYEVVIKPIQVQ